MDRDDVDFILDPDGDTMLILENPGRFEIDWEEWDEAAVPARKTLMEEECESSPPASHSPPPIEAVVTVVRYLVSSRCLMLASPYFKNVIRWRHNGDKKRGNENDAAVAETTSSRAVNSIVYTITESEWNLEALAIVLLVLHYTPKAAPIPRVLSLQKLVHIAAIVNFYDCFDAVQPFSSQWMDAFSFQAIDKFDRRFGMLLLSAIVFRRDDIFSHLTRLTIKDSPGPLPGLGLPVWDTYAEAIETKRQNIIASIYTQLWDIQTSLARGNDLGFHENNAPHVLGCLIRQMHKAGLSTVYSPSTAAGNSHSPSDLTVSQLLEKLQGLRFPAFIHILQSDFIFRRMIQAIVQSVEEDLKGTCLNGFQKEDVSHT